MEFKNLENLEINGMPSIRFEVETTLKGLFQSQITYLYTLMEGDSEILVSSAWAPTSKYTEMKPEFLGIPD